MAISIWSSISGIWVCLLAIRLRITHIRFTIYAHMTSTIPSNQTHSMMPARCIIIIIYFFSQIFRATTSTQIWGNSYSNLNRYRTNTLFISKVAICITCFKLFSIDMNFCAIKFGKHTHAQVRKETIHTHPMNSKPFNVNGKSRT